MSTIYVIRHADAGEPWGWPKDDNERPLSNFGKEQARELATTFQHFGVAKLYSSYAKRCDETVWQIQRMLNVPKENSALLGQGRTNAVTPFVRTLPDETAVICTHDDNIYALVQQINAEDQLAIPNRLVAPSGSCWVLTRSGTVFTSVTYVPPGQKPPSPAEVEPSEEEVWIE